MRSYALDKGLQPGDKVDPKDFLAQVGPEIRICPITHEDYSDLTIGEFPQSEKGLNPNPKTWETDKQVLEMDDSQLEDLTNGRNLNLESNDEFMSILVLLIIDNKISLLRNERVYFENYYKNKKSTHAPTMAAEVPHATFPDPCHYLASLNSVSAATPPLFQEMNSPTSAKHPNGLAASDRLSRFTTRVVPAVRPPGARSTSVWMRLLKLCQQEH
jgi:hypothetical protein